MSDAAGETHSVLGEGETPGRPGRHSMTSMMVALTSVSPAQGNLQKAARGGDVPRQKCLHLGMGVGGELADRSARDPHLRDGDTEARQG